MTKQEFDELLGELDSGTRRYFPYAEKIAIHYRDGDIDGVERNLELSLKWYLRFYEGNPDYFGTRSIFYEIGKIYFELKNYEKAIEYFEKSDEPSRTEPSYLARCYLYGLGVERDLARAEKIFISGKDVSVLFLAGLYERGEIYPRDEKRALELYIKAFDGSAYYPGEKTFKTAKAKVLDAAERGDAGAQLALGRYYATANLCVTDERPDYPCGVHWLSLAKKNGNPEAQEELDRYSMRGKYPVAAALKAYEYEAKAEQGDEAALCALAELYAKELLPQNEQNRGAQIENAARLGNAWSQYRLACRFFEINDKNQGFLWLEKAAEQGLPEAVKLLAERRGAEETADNIYIGDKLLPLKKSKILGLKTILIKDSTIKGFHYGGGYRGRGNTNTSDYTEVGGRDVLLCELDGQPPYKIEMLSVRAVVGDIVYTSTEAGAVIAFDARKGYSDSYSVGYDTERSFFIKALE